MLNYCPLLCYCKYSIKLSVPKPKNFEVVHTYKQLGKICMSAQQVYLIFPTELRPILRFFLKSRKAKKFEISPKTYSTATHD